MTPEKKFENKVKQYLESVGAWYVKTWSNGIQKEGIPDILACVNGYFVGIEVKATTGHPSDLQLRQIRLIRQAGGVGFVLYPEQFNDFVNVIEWLMKDDDPYSNDTAQHRFDAKLKERERRILYGDT